MSEHSSMGSWLPMMFISRLALDVLKKKCGAGVGRTCLKENKGDEQPSTAVGNGMDGKRQWRLTC